MVDFLLRGAAGSINGHQITCLAQDSRLAIPGLLLLARHSRFAASRWSVEAPERRTAVLKREYFWDPCRVSEETCGLQVGSL